jgi:glycosyltransferase involved in cell wall biosynthesis
MVMTTPLALQFFFHHHLKALSQNFDLTVVANEDCSLLIKSMGLESVRLIVIPVKREISLYSDLQGLWKLWRLMKREQFDAVWSVSPKAGLLGMLAAWLASITFRCHMFQGEVWLTRHGLIRQILRLADYLIARLANKSLVVSGTERDFLIKEGILPERNSSVLGNGSICGVNLTRFKSNQIERKKKRNELDIKDNEIVVIFLGRIKRDKGVLDLIAAWKQLNAEGVQFSLIIVGPDEDQLLCYIKEQANELKDVNFYYEDLSTVPEVWLNASDILCLPSYREGFGNVVIEASSTSLPVVASRIYGVVDAMRDGETGLSYASGNISELSNCLKCLIKNDRLRIQLGNSGRKFVRQNFDENEVINRYTSFFDENVRCLIRTKNS